MRAAVIPVMTTFSHDIKSNISLYCFISSLRCSSMPRRGSISSAPVLCGWVQEDSCADSLWYCPAHGQPSRVYGQRTSLESTQNHRRQPIRGEPTGRRSDGMPTRGLRAGPGFTHQLLAFPRYYTYTFNATSLMRPFFTDA